MEHFNHKILFRGILVWSLVLLSFSTLRGQEIPDADKEKIKEYQNLIQEHQQAGDKRKVLEYSNKLATIYWQNLHYEQAIENYQRSLEINQELGNRNGVKLTYYYLGIIHAEIEKYDTAIQYFKEGIQISRELGKTSSEVSGLINVAQTYQNMGSYKESNKWTHKALRLAKELQDLKYIRSCYGLLSENYKKIGDSPESMRYFDLFSSIDKHIKKQEISEIKQESQSEISRAQTEKAQTERQLEQEKDRRKMAEDSLERAEQISRERQMQLEMKELALKKKQAQLKLEQTIRNSFIFGFVLVSIFTVLLFHFYRQKKRANRLLSEQNKKINNQNQQIQEQRNKLQIQNTKLNDSINYAENIQSAILPEKEQLEKYFNVFILFKPKDVVSGDFYWFTEVKNEQIHKVFLAVVDCTGHGVPGAFMSMIGNRLFNEIISEQAIYEPSKILERLNDNIIEALKQEHSDNTDGMDVCLISVDQASAEEQHVQFSGAKRPLYHYVLKDRKVHTIQGDRFSIGGINKNKKQKEFTTQDIYIQQGEILYLTTDGITDQVNANGKRFSSKRLLEFFNSYAEVNLEKQKLALDYRLEQFRKDTEQRDDIAVIGVKF